jgi:hypothetical protein
MKAVLAVATSALALISALGPATAAPRLPAAAFLLTQTSIVKVDTTTWKPAATQILSLRAPRKVVYGEPFVFVLHAAGVDVLDAQSLRTLQTLRFSAEVRDIAASGSSLVVAVGNQVEVLRMGRDGRPQDRSAIALAKRADAVAIEGNTAYVLDDVRTPLYAYTIDLRRPTQPPATFRWDDTNAQLKAQAVADRWYILVHYNTVSEEGEYVTILPTNSPLRILERRSIDARRKAAPQDQPPWFIREFRVHRDTLCGVYDDGRQIILVRRSMRPEQAPIQMANPMGPARLAPEPRSGIIDLVGDHLYVAAAMGVQVFDLATQRSVGPGGILLDSPVISFALARSSQ